MFPLVSRAKNTQMDWLALHTDIKVTLKSAQNLRSSTVSLPINDGRADKEEGEEDN